MSGAAVTAVVALVAAGVLAVAVAVLWERLGATRARAAELTTRVDALGEAVERARREAADAAGTALRAARAAGVPEEPPRVVLEPITGKVVRAMALGAGARRALEHLGADRRADHGAAGASPAHRSARAGSRGLGRRAGRVAGRSGRVAGRSGRVAGRSGR